MKGLEVQNMACEMRDKVLKYLESGGEEGELENHISECEECGKLLSEHLKDGINIPQIARNVEDNKLIQRIIKRRKGLQRIVLFSIVGFVLGFLSFYYTKDKFFVTKIIMAIPYKLSDAIFSSLRPAANRYIALIGGLGGPLRGNYFIQFTLLGLIAERFTPAIIGMGLYGSLGYFTGDKKIFTLDKYVKYLIKGLAIVVLWVCLVFGVYYYNLTEMYHLKNVEAVQVLKFETNGISSIYFNLENKPQSFNDIIKGLDGKVFKDSIGRSYRSSADRVTVIFDMRFGRTVAGQVDVANNTVTLDNGDIYEVGDSFTKVVEACATNNGGELK
jgi:hypothetical protein